MESIIQLSLEYVFHSKHIFQNSKFYRYLQQE